MPILEPFGGANRRLTVLIRWMEPLGHRVSSSNGYRGRRSSNLVRRAIGGLQQRRIQPCATTTAHQVIIYSTVNKIIRFILPHLQNCPRDESIPTPRVRTKGPTLRRRGAACLGPNGCTRSAGGSYTCITMSRSPGIPVPSQPGIRNTISSLS